MAQLTGDTSPLNVREQKLNQYGGLPSAASKGREVSGIGHQWPPALTLGPAQRSPAVSS
jgi:hypothetical protein